MPAPSYRLVAQALLLLLLAPWSFAVAGDSHNQLRITVLDEHKKPVAEATVELKLGDRTIATATTGAAGEATLEMPATAGYAIEIRKPGFQTTRAPLEPGTATLEVSLPAATLVREKVDVSATSENPVEVQAPPLATIEAAQAKDSPSRPATVADALPLIPGVVRAQDGSLGIAGLGENHSALLVNSVNVTDPVTGEFGLTVPIDSVQSISVAESPYLAQYGRFTAGVVTAETRRGTEKWDYSVNDPLPEFRIRSGHLHGIRAATPRVNFSGPLIKDKLYLLEGGEYLYNQQAVRTLPFPVNESRSTAINSFTQLDWTLNNRQTLTSSFHFGPRSLRYAGLGFFNPQPVTPDAYFHDLTGTLAHRVAIGEGVLQTTVAVTSVSSSIVPRGAADMVLSPTGNSGNYFSQEVRYAKRYQWLESWSPRSLDWHGAHNLQIGTVVSYSRAESRFSARPVSIQDAGGHTLQRIEFTGGRPISLHDTEPAVYVQDHWVIHPHLAVDAGMRLEAQTITHTLRNAPRAGLVWTPDKQGRTVVRGGFGIFYDSVPLSVYKFNRYPAQTITTFDAAGNIVGDPQHFFNVVQRVTRSHCPFVCRSSNLGSFAPYSIAGNVEVEQTVNKLVKLRVKYLQSQLKDMVRVTAQPLRMANAYVLDSSGKGVVRQLEFTARLGEQPKRQLFFSYVRQHARGDVNDATGYLGNFPFPVIRQDLVASLNNEIPNRFLLWGNYAVAHKIQFSPLLEYRNGFAYRTTDVFQQYVQSQGPQTRFPRYFSMDLRISKDIQISAKHAVQLSTSLLNLTNHFNPLDVHSNLGDPLYGRFFGNYHRRFLIDFDFLY